MSTFLVGKFFPPVEQGLRERSSFPNMGLIRFAGYLRLEGEQVEGGMKLEDLGTVIETCKMGKTLRVPRDLPCWNKWLFCCQAEANLRIPGLGCGVVVHL